ncbi:MAG: hypothetical protein ACYTHN_21715 [Planctomycetota bacterium]|jgi:tetratricopeptide (TPR) repeat protein
MKTIHEIPTFNAKGEEGNYALPFRMGLTFARLAGASAKTGGNAGTLWRRSLSALEEARRLRPGLWQAHALEGSLLEKQGRFGDAVEAYRKALSHRAADVSLRQKLVRASMTDMVVTAFGTPRQKAGLRGARSRIQKQSTRIHTRKPKSARIRKYYSIGRVRQGA